MNNKHSMLATALVASALFLGGCRNDPEIARLMEENQRLHSKIVDYEAQNRELLTRLQARPAVDPALTLELDKKERKIQALQRAVQELQGKVKLTAKAEHELELLAQRLGGTLVGNRLLLPGDFFFPSGSYTLRESAREDLRKLAEILKDENVTLLITGHTDNVPVLHAKKRGIQDNRHLSVMRALAVLNELKNAGFPDERMYPTGWGALRPEAPNATEAGRLRNRRVEIYIDPAASGFVPLSAITNVGGVESGEGISVEGPSE